ncbi:hypothetical protein HPB49_025474 [Dermacentor silvarum]|uniref:Uncharacterized protein n=1 Tax=Dermacentor silvarum TaxID=543639 RepID=A0ACB8DHJ0_DERSI|nr:uncharacterized protein LOC119442688 isoform X2 [Dermacentor silvarum]KAH7967539.1 hypothetical protein HPB49_025474 [Dermacentor silvarum]
MASYEIVLFLLALLIGVVLRRAAPVAELGVVEQLERKLNSLENQKRKLKRQLADFRARASKSDTRLLEDTSATREGQAQMYVDLDKHRSDLEDASHELEVCAHNHEEAVKLLHFCRSTVLENLSSAIELAERRNAAVSKLYFEVFGETNGNVQLLSELTDPWRRWAELLAVQRDRTDRVFTHCLERASRRKKIEVEDLPAPAGFQLTWEPDYGFDRILDLVRLRLSSPISRSESVADFEYLRCASNLSPASTLCGGGSGNGGGGGSGSSVSNTNCFGSVRKSGYLRLARTLHKRMPEVPEERLVACLETLRSQNGGLTGLRISEIREEVSRLIQEWPSSAVR